MSNKSIKASNAQLAIQRAYVLPEEPRAVRVIGIIALDNGRFKTKHRKPKVKKARKPRATSTGKASNVFVPEFTLIKGKA